MVNRAMSWQPTRLPSSRGIKQLATVKINGLLHTKDEIQVCARNPYRCAFYTRGVVKVSMCAMVVLVLPSDAPAGCMKGAGV